MFEVHLQAPSPTFPVQGVPVNSLQLSFDCQKLAYAEVGNDEAVNLLRQAANAFTCPRLGVMVAVPKISVDGYTQRIYDYRKVRFVGHLWPIFQGHLNSPTLTDQKCSTG